MKSGGAIISIISGIFHRRCSLSIEYSSRNNAFNGPRKRVECFLEREQESLLPFLSFYLGNSDDKKNSRNSTYNGHRFISY